MKDFLQIVKNLPQRRRQIYLVVREGLACMPTASRNTPSDLQEGIGLVWLSGWCKSMKHFYLIFT